MRTIAGHIRPTHCYVGRCPGCGAVQASRYDQADKDTGRAVAEMVADGLLVERVPLGSTPMSECTCPRPERQERLFV